MITGRPCKLTANMHINIISGVKSGASDSMVADLVGLDSSTIFKWSARGKQDMLDELDTKYSQFFIEYKKNKAERDIRLVEFVEMEAVTNWTAAMRLLEVRRASEFGRGATSRDPIELSTGERGAFIRQILQMVSDNHISADEALKLTKIKLDADNTDCKTTLLDRIKAMEQSD